jgi:hypothetical protein
MTNQQHPITPSPELRCQWQSESPFKVISVQREDYMIDRAAQWGADQEMEACCEWFKKNTDCHIAIEFLREARRPKPPSLKEQALTKLTQIVVDLDRAGMRQQASILEGPIRLALESLKELEKL